MWTRTTPAVPHHAPQVARSVPPRVPGPPIQSKNHLIPVFEPPLPIPAEPAPPPTPPPEVLFEVVVMCNCKRAPVIAMNTTQIFGRVLRFFSVCDRYIEFYRNGSLVHNISRDWCPRSFHYACQSQDAEQLVRWLLAETADYFLIIEDDVVMCRDFDQALDRLVAAADPNLVFLGRGNLGQLVRHSFLPRLAELHAQNHHTYLDLHIRGNCRIPEDRCFALKHSIVQHVHNIPSVVGHGIVPFGCNDTDPDMQYEGLRWLPVLSFQGDRVVMESYDTTWNLAFLSQDRQRACVVTTEAQPRYLTPVRGPMVWGQNIQYKLSPEPYYFEVAFWSTGEQAGYASLRSLLTGHFVTANARKVLHQYSLMQRDALWRPVPLGNRTYELLGHQDGRLLGHYADLPPPGLYQNYLVAWEKSTPFTQNTLCTLQPSMAAAERLYASQDLDGELCLMNLEKFKADHTRFGLVPEAQRHEPGFQPLHLQLL